MRRTLILLALALGLVGSLTWAENWFTSVSVTATSSTTTLPTARASVELCNYGASIAYARVFNEFDTAAAATTSYTPIPAGSSTNPICKEFVRTDTEPANIKWVSLICATGQTATVTIDAY